MESSNNNGVLHIPYIYLKRFRDPALAIYLAILIDIQQVKGANFAVNKKQIEDISGLSSKTQDRCRKKLIGLDMLTIVLKKDAEHSYSPVLHYTVNDKIIENWR